MHQKPDFVGGRESSEQGNSFLLLTLTVHDMRDMQKNGCSHIEGIFYDFLRGRGSFIGSMRPQEMSFAMKYDCSPEEYTYHGKRKDKGFDGPYKLGDRQLGAIFFEPCPDSRWVGILQHNIAEYGTDKFK